jgi:hypothetical protein
MDSWFLIGIEWKIEVIFIEIFLALTAKISRTYFKIKCEYFMWEVLTSSTTTLMQNRQKSPKKSSRHLSFKYFFE